MKFRPAILSLFLASLAAAQPAPVTAIERANADAVSRLYARIAAEEIADVPVAQIVDKVDGYRILMDGLARAEQLGGPRQVANDVVQVRLQISGARASQLLLQAVAARPDRSPVPPDRLAFLLKDWNDRSFTSTGDNVEPPAATTSRPAEMRVAMATAPSERVEPAMTWRPAPKWVNDPLVASGTATSTGGSPLRTARAAEQAARKSLHEKLRALSMGDAVTIGDAADKRPDVAAAVDECVAGAHVAGVDYRGDGSVEVRISTGGQRLWQRLVVAR